MPRWPSISSARTQHGHTRIRGLSLRPAGSWPARHALRWPLQHLHQVQVPDRFLLELLHHLFEHVEGFALVLDQRIVLPIAPQPNALLQVIHIEEVVFPQRIEHAQHDHALVIAHGFGPDQLLLAGIAFLQLVEDRIAEFPPIQCLRFDTLGIDVYAKTGEDSVLQALQVPFFEMSLQRAELVDQLT